MVFKVTAKEKGIDTVHEFMIYSDTKDEAIQKIELLPYTVPSFIKPLDIIDVVEVKEE